MCPPFYSCIPSTSTFILIIDQHLCQTSAFFLHDRTPSLPPFSCRPTRPQTQHGWSGSLPRPCIPSFAPAWARANQPCSRICHRCQPRPLLLTLPALSDSRSAQQVHSQQVRPAVAAFRCCAHARGHLPRHRLHAAGSRPSARLAKDGPATGQLRHRWPPGADRRPAAASSDHVEHHACFQHDIGHIRTQWRRNRTTGRTD